MAIVRTRSLLLLASLALAACGEGITSPPRESTTLELAPGMGLRQIKKGQYRADERGVWKDGRLMIAAARLPVGQLAEIRTQLAFFEATYEKRAKSGCAKVDASGAMVARPGLAAYGDPELSCDQIVTYMNNAEAAYQ